MQTGLPAERTILGSFRLPDQRGRMLDLERFRQQRNLVLIFVKRIPAAEALLRALAGQQVRLSEEEAVVLAVVQGDSQQAERVRQDLRIPFTVLADQDGRIVSALAGSDCAVYITDRFREIFARRAGPQIFAVDEVLEWLAHINRQCPE